MFQHRVAAWAFLPFLFVFNSCSRPKTPEDSGNWLMYGRTYDDHRFSPLNQVNEQTVAKLGLAWSRELGTTRGLEATPLVEDGVIYTTGSWSVVYAIDAKTGEIRWTYDPKVPRERAYFICCDVVNRGVALNNGKVYVGTLDGRLIALDKHSGTPVWTAATTDSSQPYSITGAPRIAKGLVIIGNAGSEYGVRGYVSAYDARNRQDGLAHLHRPGRPFEGVRIQGHRSRREDVERRIVENRRRRLAVGRHRLRSCARSAVLRHGQRDGLVSRPARRRRQSVHRFDPGRARKQWRDRLVFPNHARR